MQAFLFYEPAVGPHSFHAAAFHARRFYLGRRPSAQRKDGGGPIKKLRMATDAIGAHRRQVLARSGIRDLRKKTVKLTVRVLNAAETKRGWITEQPIAP